MFLQGIILPMTNGDQQRITQHKRFVPSALAQIPPSAELLSCWERYTPLL